MLTFQIANNFPVVPVECPHLHAHFSQSAFRLGEMTALTFHLFALKCINMKYFDQLPSQSIRRISLTQSYVYKHMVGTRRTLQIHCL